MRLLQPKDMVIELLLIEVRSGLLRQFGQLVTLCGLNVEMSHVVLVLHVYPIDNEFSLYMCRRFVYDIHAVIGLV